ncbi:MAG: ABC-2 transporter permease, partial [Pyrinomonadaceae bacterium]|nr:ABC-2 transporter permease [Pyrinomonadaceae bacterium]
PFVSIELNAVIEKELRYAMRNAQLRVLGVMPLVLIAVRLMPSRWQGGRGRGVPPGLAEHANSFAFYSEGMMAVFGVLYVFMLLSSLACNSFAFDDGGMRALILSPVERRTILIGKNVVIALIAVVFALLLLLVNQLVFGDLTIRAIVFVLLCLPVFAVLMTLAGNWLSMRFPKRLKFGKRLNMTGMAGLLLLPLFALMVLLPVVAAAAGYLAQSLVVKYATLALFAGAAVALYRPVVASQGRELARREQEILETVSGQTEA